MGSEGKLGAVVARSARADKTGARADKRRGSCQLTRTDIVR